MLSEVGTTVLSSDKHLRNGNFSCRLTVAKLFLLEKEGKNAVFKAVFFFFFPPSKCDPRTLAAAGSPGNS